MDYQLQRKRAALSCQGIQCPVLPNLGPQTMSHAGCGASFVIPQGQRNSLIELHTDGYKWVGKQVNAQEPVTPGPGDLLWEDKSTIHWDFIINEAGQQGEQGHYWGLSLCHL